MSYKNLKDDKIVYNWANYFLFAVSATTILAILMALLVLCWIWRRRERRQKEKQDQEKLIMDQRLNDKKGTASSIHLEQHSKTNNGRIGVE